MLKMTYEELKNEFANKRTIFTDAEIEELAFYGYIAIKDYKNHHATVEGGAQ